MRESTVENAIIKEIKKLGGKSVKFLPYLVNGMPDRLVILPFKPMFFIEVKAPGEKSRKLQKAIHKQLRQLGVTVLVIDNIKQFRDAIQTI